MATIKSYTDLEQSKTLSKILPINSANMFYVAGKGEPIFIENKMVAYGDDDYDALGGPDILCWSLAALLGTLTENKLCHYDNRYYCQYISEGGEFPIYSTAEYDNPVDACVAMIEKLHELNMIKE